jgi:signal transduction histidine kinase
VTEIDRDGWRLTLDHDQELEPDVLQAAAAYAAGALEHTRLTVALASERRELQESRANSVAAKDREREKIERDLHDGAQQRLIAVRLKLELAAERLAAPDPDGAELIRRLASEVGVTIDEVRAFARGIFPALLAQTGLAEALRSLGRAAALPTTVEASGLRRYRSAVETSVFFSCSEALQNAAKHARGATHVVISVWEQNGLHLTITDDGAGFDVVDRPAGTGLSNLRDRLDAVGGVLQVRSAPGHGTTISGFIQLP